MSKIISGVFDSRVAATEAVQSLLNAGFGQADISMLMSDSTQGREFRVTESTKAPEGATAGATAGGVLGAIVASLVALGDLVIPGISLVAAGPIVAALAGAGAGGALGGLLGGLVGMGIPEHEARLMAQQVERGGILVGVMAHDDRAKIAEQVLKSLGGVHIRTNTR